MTAFLRRHLKGDESPQVFLDKVVAIIATRGRIGENDIREISRECEMDSLDTVELIMALEEEFGITIDPQ